MRFLHPVLFNAHIPFVILFLLFVAIMVFFSRKDTR